LVKTTVAPPKFKAKSLVEFMRDNNVYPIRGVVVECNGSSVTVLDDKNNVVTVSEDKVKDVVSSFAVVAKDRNGRAVRLISCLCRFSYE
jgi:hypothetical protein